MLNHLLNLQYYIIKTVCVTLGDVVTQQISCGGN